MDWEQALRQRLLDDAAIGAIVGSGVDWSKRPQDRPLPWLGLRLVSDPRPQDLKGFVGRRQSRVQADCWAATRAEAVALREAAIACLVPAGEFHGVRFGRGFIAEPGARDLGQHTEAGFVHRDSLDFLIWHD